jgi:hypothetical protein
MSYQYQPPRNLSDLRRRSWKVTIAGGSSLRASSEFYGMVITADSARELCEVASAIEEAKLAVKPKPAKLEKVGAASLPPATPNAPSSHSEPRPSKANRNARPVEILEVIRYGKQEE